MQRILVPLDGSPLAEAILPYVEELASRLSASVHLVRVVPLARQLATAGMVGSGGIDGISGSDIRAIDEAVAAQMQEARTYLEQQASRLQSRGIKVQWEVRQGGAAEAVIKCALEKNSDLIAISTHGRTGLGRLVFGSVFDRVLRDAGIPVLVVKPTHKGGASASGAAHA
ncbi:MAG: universal stress protein [Chloroflexi bacterium]|nr:universal stress protein [Chloroflexota bacterium]